MANYTKLMARLFNKIARKMVWPTVTQIKLVKKSSGGAYEAYVTVKVNWFAYRTEALEGGQPVIAVLITDGTPDVTPANVDLLAGVAVADKMYRKNKIYPPFGEPAYWRLEVQPTGEPFTA